MARAATPFRAADVYYDWKVLDRNSESGQLRLDLFVVPRPEADSMVKAVTGRGFRLAGVDVVDGSRTLGLNLLPADQRTKSVNPKTRLNLALGAACAALLGLVMMQSLYLRSHQVAELEEAITAVQGEARQVMTIKQQIEDT